jgi:hypothetical protein
MNDDIFCLTLYKIKVGNYIYYSRYSGSIGEVLEVYDDKILIKWDDEEKDCYAYFDSFTNEGFDQYYQIITDKQKVLELILRKK